MLFVLLSTSLVGSTISTNCSSTCPGYSVCSSLKNSTKYNGFLKDSLVCNTTVDKEIGNLLRNTSDCKLRDASAILADMIGMGWDGVGVVETYMGDEELWLPGCQFDKLAGAACAYYSLPEDRTVCSKGNVTRSSFFCKDYCSKLFHGCINFKKYWHLEDEFTVMCDDISSGRSTDCFNGEIDQPGLSTPNCPKTPDVKAASLTGPYAMAGVALALALVALIGLILTTCRNAENGGAPGSF